MNSNTEKGYFERFAFGDSPEMADELLALELAGKKNATVSVVLENEQTPSVGDLSSGKDFDGHTWANTIASNNDAPMRPGGSTPPPPSRPIIQPHVSLHLS